MLGVGALEAFQLFGLQASVVDGLGFSVGFLRGKAAFASVAPLEAKGGLSVKKLWSLQSFR
jgi:hypothetical protein